MIPLCVPEIRGNEWNYIKECLDTNWVSSVGSYVDKFELSFREYVHAEKAVVTMNGTSALHLALLALGISAGDEVIVPSLTFISSVSVVRYVGAEPVFVDVCRDTYCIDTNKIEELITPKTKAVIPVHLYGHPADMEPLMELSRKYNLYVIEDATEGLGALYKGEPVGTIGHIGCFSFNGNKLITTGAGGMLVTNDNELGQKAKFLSTQAKVVNENKAVYHSEIGYNYRMPNILAAMGCAQLEKIEEYIQRKKENAAYYNEFLKEAKGITLPVEKEWSKNAYWLYSIIVEDEYGVSRDRLIKELEYAEIESRPFFMPIHKMASFRDCKCSDMEVTEELALKGLNLPSSVNLKVEQIDRVCEVIKEIKSK